MSIDHGGKYILDADGRMVRTEGQPKPEPSAGVREWTLEVELNGSGRFIIEHLTYGPPGVYHVIEKSAYEAVRKERDELRARPPTFIKLDETTEAFVQTRAAIANMKMFMRERDALAAEKIALLQLIDGQAAQLAEMTTTTWSLTAKAGRLERALVYAKTIIRARELPACFLAEIERLERGE